MFSSAPAIIAAIVALAVCGVALWRGGWPERWGAAAILATWFASPLVQTSEILDPEWGVFWLDVAALAAFLVLLLASRRGWLAVASAAQLMAVSSHLAMLIDRRITMNTYLIGLAIWSLIILLALAIGTWRAHRKASDDQRGSP